MLNPRNSHPGQSAITCSEKWQFGSWIIFHPLIPANMLMARANVETSGGTLGVKEKKSLRSKQVSVRLLGQTRVSWCQRSSETLAALAGVALTQVQAVYSAAEEVNVYIPQLGTLTAKQLNPGLRVRS